MTEQELIAHAAEQLVRQAAAFGYNLTIERQPAYPLAMGNTRSHVSVWPMRNTLQLKGSVDASATAALGAALDAAIKEFGVPRVAAMLGGNWMRKPPYGSRRAAAMAVYAPPFEYHKGYIWDSNKRMVADDDGTEGAVAARIRGWGRLQYMPNAAELQDEIGAMVADALNKLYADAPQTPSMRAQG